MSSELRQRKSGDVEANAGAGGDQSDKTVGGEPQANLPEYAALERYISTYREDGAKYGYDDGDEKANKSWWQFWKSSGDSSGDAASKTVMPDNWLDTDIHTGIHASQVEERRKFSGWNELTAEKENWLAKFLSFFTGPILYGEFCAFPARGQLAQMF